MPSPQQISARTPFRLPSLPALAVAALTLLLSGCALTDTATTHSPIPGPAISGVAFGGQQPIFAAKVYLLAANSLNGYGSGSFSLLTVGGTGSADTTIGAYTTTTSSGSFNLAPGGKADYECTKGYTLGADTTGSPQANLPGDEQVYLYIQGGNAGASNSSIGLLAALGPCNNIYSNTITVNELTTIAAAYAFAGYATNATHIASNNTTLAVTGLSNAGLNSANLVNLATGQPVANSSGITRPVATLNTLADILAACVNGKASSNNCSTLFNYTKASGTSGTAPNETATAAINLAHNPWPSAAGMSALYGLVPATGAPFPGALSSQPNDFTLSLAYTGGGLSYPTVVAIDASGNAWVANWANDSTAISKFSSTGNPFSSTGFTGGGLSSPYGIAIDNSGNAWVTNSNNSVSEFTSTGTAISPSTGYTGNGFDIPKGIAIDGSGNVWVANNGNNSVTELSSSGSLLAFSSNIAGLDQPFSIAVDASGGCVDDRFQPSNLPRQQTRRAFK
jgi:hypothetical protein